MKDDFLIQKIRDNGDGTETWLVPVRVNSDLIRGYEIIGMRHAEPGELFITWEGDDIVQASRSHDEMRIIVQQVAPWNPPKSLKPGRYQWHRRLGTETFYFSCDGSLMAVCSDHWEILFMDSSPPPREGFWIVNKDGTAVFDGD